MNCGLHSLIAGNKEDECEGFIYMYGEYVSKSDGTSPVKLLCSSIGSEISRNFCDEWSFDESQAEYALDEIRVPHAHTAQQITTELLEWADIVLTMTLAHQNILAREFPGFQH